jgi:hypothetical protein
MARRLGNVGSSYCPIHDEEAAMSWFDDLKQTLPAYYPLGSAPDVVGYLRGSIDPGVWRGMERSGRQQMLILGSKPPSTEDWVAAGVAARGADQVVKFGTLTGFIVLYGGFSRRPWGKIFVSDALGLAQFPKDLLTWKRNYVPPKP